MDDHKPVNSVLCTCAECTQQREKEFFCCICGVEKEPRDFLGRHGKTIRFLGGHIARIFIKPGSHNICDNCLWVMEKLLANSTALYPDKVRLALDQAQADAQTDHKALTDDAEDRTNRTQCPYCGAPRKELVAVGRATEILSVHNQLQTELAEKDTLIDQLRKTIAKLEAERESWQEPKHFSEDV